MNKSKPILNEKKYNKLIVVLSIVIPVVIAALFGIKIDVELPVFLPPIYACLNALTAFVLVLAFIAIQNKKIKRHERLSIDLSRMMMPPSYQMSKQCKGTEHEPMHMCLFVFATSL